MPQSPNSCFDRLLAERRTIEDEMNWHEKALLRLKSQLNELTPISRLPPECFIEIFKTYVGAYFYDNFGESSYFHPIPFIQVCRSWRMLALNSSILWNVIDIRCRPEHISFFLEHSKEVPLDVYCPSPTENFEPEEDAVQLATAREFFQDNISRIRTLVIVVHPDIADIRVGRASRLKQLTVLETKDRDKEDKKAFLGLLRGIDAPLIQYLHYQGTETAWLSDAQHSNLTEFNLENAEFDSIASLLSALRGMPVLETFYLNSTLPEGLLPSRSKCDIVTLSHLRTIEVGDHDGIQTTQNSLAFNLLSYLELPLVTRTWITLVECSHGDSPLASIHSFSRFQHASIVRVEASDGQIGWSMSLLSMATTTMRESSLALALCSKSRSHFEVASNRILVQLAMLSVKVLPLSDVDTLSVEGESLRLTPFFHMMPLLRTLQLVRNKWTIYAFFTEVCGSKTSADEQERSLPLALPHLKVLHLSEVVFPPANDQLQELMTILNINTPGSKSVCLKTDTLIYDACVNLDGRTAKLLAELTGAVEVKFVEQAAEQ